MLTRGEKKKEKSYKRLGEANVRSGEDTCGEGKFIKLGLLIKKGVLKKIDFDIRERQDYNGLSWG